MLLGCRWVALHPGRSGAFLLMLLLLSVYLLLMPFLLQLA